MNPVNTPGIFFVTSICVLYVLWKDEEFVGTNLIRCFSDLVPSVAVNAIENEILGQSFFSIGIMSARVRIVAEAGNVKLL